MKAEEIKKVLSTIYFGLTLKHQVACKEAIKAVEKTEPRPVIYESDGFADGAPFTTWQFARFAIIDLKTTKAHGASRFARIADRR